jgi:hypothetical protein
VTNKKRREWAKRANASIDHARVWFTALPLRRASPRAALSGCVGVRRNGLGWWLLMRRDLSYARDRGESECRCRGQARARARHCVVCEFLAERRAGLSSARRNHATRAAAGRGHRLTRLQQYARARYGSSRLRSNVWRRINASVATEKIRPGPWAPGPSTGQD